MYRKPDHVAYVRDGEHTIVMHLATGASLGLSREAAHIWELVLAHGEPDAVVAELASRYPVEPALLRDDVLDLLRQFGDAGLLEESPSLRE